MTMSEKKSSTNKSTNVDRNTNDYNQYRDKNTTLGDQNPNSSTNKRSTSGTGPRDSAK